MSEHSRKGVSSRLFGLPPILTGLVAGLVVGVAGSWTISGARQPAVVQASVAAPSEPQPVLTRVGARIVVPPNSPLRGLLAVEEPAMKDVSRMLVLPAVVEADPTRTVKVLPPVAGRVIELKVQLGTRVTEGQELAVIDSSDLALAFSDEEKARSAVKLTKQALDRMLGLEKTAAIAVKDREQAQSDSAQADAELERAQSRLRAIGVPPDRKEKSRLLSLKAPITGSVIDLQMAPGAFLNDPTAAVMTLANLDTIWVTANVPEKDVSFVSPDQTVSVAFASYPDKVFDGKVLFISDVIEPDTRRNKVRIAFDNPDKALKPNMFANATFVAPSLTRIVVPNSALMMTNDKTSVFVEVASWAFERRDVEIAYQDGASSAIKSGLQAGERVVVRGAVRLND
jgi:cobalt-zinc-cadmium efflux system membrane fusion protein